MSEQPKEPKRPLPSRGISKESHQKIVEKRGVMKKSKQSTDLVDEISRGIATAGFFRGKRKVLK
jgi:hypothetical protein